ncbi:large conductance mechanosensitive channel protein MscL [Lysinibacillus endophyticus]|uniref:Large-conductance mechanosensitive channel n=1 Tax=Ureibacillus endophyticus TaxID=1978490 RepID=A0A494YW76_9BACL|nr:large conductance mechanosensitive channel protein MscL [Lysinibacillus endophyticus]MCP1144944.1 large conductance mechanosensitive channel protein MscL [Lysinibacillus endophyticus]RKQ14461.1 large conductance mechanosensitive channel protein MscL [Lysinibacillus endophyticus]
MWKDFKEFAMKGNILDLAIAVVIGGAFGSIVTSLVENIIMPLVGMLTGGIDLTKSFVFGPEDSLKLGVFLQSIIDFLIISFSIFMALRILTKLNRKKKEEVAAAEPAPEIDTKEELLKEIRDLLKNQQS